MTSHRLRITSLITDLSISLESVPPNIRRRKKSQNTHVKKFIRRGYC